MLTLKQLAEQIQADYFGTAELPFQGVSVDSRTLKPGELFVALHGKQDGHAWAEAALSKGASALMVDHQLPFDIPQIIVSDTLLGLGALASIWRQQFRIPVIALTGSCGKTTSKEMIASILAELGPTLATTGNFNNAIGVPLTLLRLTAAHRFAVLEIGTNSPGEIAYATSLVAPSVSLITNIEAQHIEKLGSVKGISEEKSDIFAYLNQQGIAIINTDEPFAKSWQAKIMTEHQISFGLNPKAHVRAEHISTDLFRCEFDLITPLGPQAISIPNGGQHMVMNALAAAAACLAVGANLKQIAEGLAKLQAVAGRFKLHTLASGALLIDDSYNASFKSVENAIATLQKFSGTKIFVMTHMGELGPQTESFHQALGQLCQSAHLDHVFLFGNKELLQYTQKAYPDAKYFESKAALTAALLPLLAHNHSLAIIKGSRANKMEDIVHMILTHGKG